MPQSSVLQARYMSGERGGGRKGFLGEFLDNLKQELSKNKEMKENLKKFREEAKRLEESDALKQARRKYVSGHQKDSSCLNECLISTHRPFCLLKKTIESETVKTSEVLKKKLENISETVKEVNVISVCYLNAEVSLQALLFSQPTL